MSPKVRHCLLLSFLTLLWAVGSQAAPVNYDIIYVRQPRFGDTTNTIWPEVFHPCQLDAGADLMLLHTNGAEEVLVPGGTGSVTDPSMSFDGRWCYYAYYPDLTDAGLNGQRDNLPYAGSDIYRINIQTRAVQRLTFQEFTPNTGAAKWDYADPTNPSSSLTTLGYGIMNLAPCPVPGGKIAFVSNRNGFTPPKSYTSPTLQLFVMDEDGQNVVQIAPMNIGSALHPTPLQDGRIMYSSFESQGLRDERMWGIWTIWPDGRIWEPLVSAFHSGQAFHFMTQISSGDVVVVDYYNLNNNGFGALFRLPVTAAPGQPRFYSAFQTNTPPLDQTVGAGYSYPFTIPFQPVGMYALTPFTHPQDEAAPLGAGGVRVGKFTHPSGAPNNDLLVVWSPGPANNQSRPTPTPYYDAGLYLIPGSITVTNPSQLILIKNDPRYNEAWPRAVVSWKAIHGTDTPAELGWLPNDGSAHPDLPPGTPYGIVGTSSLYKRESFPGDVPPWADFFNGLDAFNTSENGQSSNWDYQGSDDGRYWNSNIYAIRIVAMEPNSHRSYGPNSGGPYNDGNFFVSHARERLRILGEIPVRKFGTNGAPILDPEGNPDTSFMAKIPGDTPFTFQMLDQDGLVLAMAQTWHQVRPGEVRNNCGGCHAHSQAPLLIQNTVAGQPGYKPIDLTTMVTLLSKNTNGLPTIKTNPPGAVNVEFLRDIRPVLQRSCLPCHSQTNTASNAQLVLDDYSDYNGLPGDYERLADDSGAQWGYKPVIGTGTWRQSNASRYVRMFQSRRSLLMWKIFGRRLDGWSNSDHPTETSPGDPTMLPTGTDPNTADLDYTGSIMPPPNSGVPPLTEDEKITFGRWIDLGCPINTASGDDATYGWFLDEIRPTLTISSPRQNQNTQPLTELRIGVADADSGLNTSSLSVTADFPVNGASPGNELSSQGKFVAPGIFSIPLNVPISNLNTQHVTALVADRQGNTNKVTVRFWISTSFQILSLDGSLMASGVITARVENPNLSTNHIVLVSSDPTVPLGKWTPLTVTQTYDESPQIRVVQAKLPSNPPRQLFLRIEAR
ncbi:MAG TPA: hypothetical protein VKY92_06680 [Verrucomicrobiae bacterium]|nr:hypothetical protein [Verrucomicrobiae bacterium]